MLVRPLSVALAAKAKEELNEDPNRVENCVEHLRNWILQQPHLKARTDDQSLVIFLRRCKYRLERAKERIDSYYSLRTAVPEMFWVENMDHLYMEMIKSGVIFPLQKTASPTSPKIVMVRWNGHDLHKTFVTGCVAMGHTVLRILSLEDDYVQVCGVEVLFDMARTSMLQLAQVAPAMLKKISVFFQNASPVHLTRFHVINSPPGFETIFNLVKAFVKEKNLQRIHVYNQNYESLYKHIPKTILPEGYGYDDSSIQSISDYWINKMEEYRSVLIEDQTFGTDESKRPGKPRTDADLFGIDGSFMQLEID